MGRDGEQAHDQPDYERDGKPKTPALTVKSGNVVLSAADYNASYANNVQAGTATATATGKGNYTGSVSCSFTIADPSVTVTYCTHCQTYGWLGNVSNGAVSGTTGQSKRLEALNIRLANPKYSGSIEYRTHLQFLGWEANYRRDGATSGTTGQSRRMEAVQIRLTGDMAKHYDVWYRVHCQTYGWLGWAKNDQRAGTAGYSKRMGAVQIVVLPKGQVPSATYQGVTQATATPYMTRTGA